MGMHLDRSTLALWVKRAAWWLKSLYELQLRTIHASPRIFCDETPMPVSDPGRRRSKPMPKGPRRKIQGAPRHVPTKHHVIAPRYLPAGAAAD
jgi:Transposase IS66 family